MFNEAYASTVPLVGSTVAPLWDNLYWFLVWLSVFFFILVVGGMVYFAVKYRKHTGAKPKYITGNHLLEAVWIAVPTVLLLVIFGWGYFVYHRMVQAPTDAYEIRVIGKQWLWQFHYDNGRATTGDLYVPINRPVKLIMTSEDVLHSFFIPNFRVKQDVVPGMYTSVWFEATVPGKHQVFCAEYCGTSHSGMLAQVIVLNDQQWKDWHDRGKEVGDIPNASAAATTDEFTSAQATAQPAKAPVQLTLAEQGQRAVQTKGCVACHSPDGTQKVGPTFKGLFGSTVQLNNGATAIADENYIRESIENPQAKVVQGFSPTMPAFRGLISETEMNGIISYIKTLK